MKLLSTGLAAAFPAFLLRALRAESDSVRRTSTLLACMSFGIIVFTLMALH